MATGRHALNSCHFGSARRPMMTTSIWQEQRRAVSSMELQVFESGNRAQQHRSARLSRARPGAPAIGEEQWSRHAAAVELSPRSLNPTSQSHSIDAQRVVKVRSPLRQSSRRYSPDAYVSDTNTRLIRNSPRTGSTTRLPASAMRICVYSSTKSGSMGPN